MSSSNLSLVSANADNGHHDLLDLLGHHYPAQSSTVADRPLHTPPSYVSASHMHVAAPSHGRASTHDHFFAQFNSAGKEPKSTADPSGLAMSQTKLQDPHCCRLEGQPSWSLLSSDQAVADQVCSTATAQIRSWSLESNQDVSIRLDQAPSTQSVSEAVRLLAMTAGVDEGIPGANSFQGDILKPAELAKFEREACYGYPQVKAAASIMLANVDSNRHYGGNSSQLDERSCRDIFVASGHPSEITVVSDWFQPPASRSSASIDQSLPVRPGNLQTSKSAYHEYCTAVYNFKGNRHNDSLIINHEANYGAEQDQNISHRREAQAEALAFQYAQRYSSSEHNELESLRLDNGSERVGHIPVGTLMQTVQQQAAGARSLDWDHGNLTSVTNATTKELLLLNRLQATSSTGRTEISSNNNQLPHCSSGTAYDADDTAGDVDLEQLPHRQSSLHDNYNYPQLTTYSRASTSQQQGDQLMLAGGGHQFDSVISGNPGMPLALSWDESYCKVENHIPAINIPPTTVMVQQTQPVSGAIKSTISGNTMNHSGPLHPAAVFFRSHQSAQLRLPNTVVGGLSRYIQPEDLSLSRPPSGDFLSLDCTYSRSGSMSVIRASRYLKPAQQLLEECCNIKLDHSTRAATWRTVDKSKEACEALDRSSVPKQPLSAEERCHVQMRKARLIGMVEELDRRYQQYQYQMQLIVTSFESATGMGAAVPYTAFARKHISKQFRALRDAIGEHIRTACRTLGEDISSVPVLNKGETPRLRILDQRLRHHRTLQQVGMMQQHQAWRPQRGLPERSVTVLRAWLFEHFLHPYPKDSEKLMLARLTGLTRSQVANWFINARVRLWKPMVEQMYAEESKEGEFQDAVEARTAQHGRQDNGDFYAWSGGHLADGVTTPAEHVNDGRSSHCQKSQRLSHESTHGAMSHDASMTRHGVSLTLALPNSSSLELPPSSYDPNHQFGLQSASEDVNFTFV